MIFQKCKKCGSEWNSANKSVTCSFCGEDLSEDKTLNTIDEVFKYLFTEYGIELISDRRKFISLLSDFAPSMENERRLIKIAIESGVYTEILDANDKDEGEQTLCLDKMIARLEQQNFLSREWAQKVVCWLTRYLAWNTSFVQEGPSSHMSNVKQVPSHITSFDSSSYLKFNQDSDYVAAQKQDREENYSRAFNLYQRAFNNGNILAGIKLALLYSSGNGVEMSKEKAYQIFLTGQQAGDPLAKAWIAEYYRMGYAVPQDKEKAKEFLIDCLSDLEQMCACGDGDAQYYLGYEYLYGLSLDKDETKAFALLNKAYSAGIISAGVALADCYLNGIGCAKDETRGLDILEACAQTTNKKAHFELAKLYYYGSHVKRDYKRAYNLFLFAAERDHKASMYYVGDCFYYGHGILKAMSMEVLMPRASWVSCIFPGLALRRIKINHSISLSMPRNTETLSQSIIFTIFTSWKESTRITIREENSCFRLLRRTIRKHKWLLQKCIYMVNMDSSKAMIKATNGL